MAGGKLHVSQANLSHLTPDDCDMREDIVYWVEIFKVASRTDSVKEFVPNVAIFEVACMISGA